MLEEVDTRTLTTGIDVLTGTADDDTFIGSFDGAATSTSNLGDEINGGTGSDTVKITSNQVTTNIPSLTNVEKLHLVKAGAAQESVNAAAIAGLETLELEGNSTIVNGEVVVTFGQGQNVILDSITDGDVADDTTDTGGTALLDEAIGLASAAGVTSLDLTVDGVGAQTGATALNDLDLDVTGNGVATANITAVGTNNISLANAGGALTTVNVAGEGALNIWGTTAATINTFNAADNSGGVVVDLSASTSANQTITGSSGNDSLTVDLARNITLDAGAGDDVVAFDAGTVLGDLSSTTGSADSINGGEGTDTLSVTAATAASLAGDTAADRGVITGFEALRIGAADIDTDNAGAEADFNISRFGLNTLQINGVIADADNSTVNTLDVTGFTSGATVEFRAADTVVGGTQATVNVGMTGATNASTPDDTLNVSLNADLVNQAAANNSLDVALGVNGINKLNVTTADRANTDGATGRDDGYTLSLSQASNVDTITVDGDRELSFTSGTATDALANFNAADLTGDLIVNLSGFTGTQGVTVTGGAGTNTLTGTGLSDIIVGGDRVDTIAGGNGADKLTGNGGADIFQFALGATTSSTGGSPAAGSFDEITDFEAASDVIDFTDQALSLSTDASATASVGNAAINAEGFASFNAADDTLAEKVAAVNAALNAGTAADGQIAIFEDSGNTYVFVTDITNSTAVDAEDALIQLTGVTGLSDATISGGGDLTIA